MHLTAANVVVAHQQPVQGRDGDDPDDDGQIAAHEAAESADRAADPASGVGELSAAAWG